jgi:TIR domain/Domain of unknown function (DUF4062)
MPSWRDSVTSMETGAPRVFLSYTPELRMHPPDRSFVAAAEQAVNRAGYAVMQMAYFFAPEDQKATLRREEMRRTDIYVGIIGFQYGAPVKEVPELSYTELEFAAATEARLPRLVFLLDEHAALLLPRSYRSDSRFEERQQAFRARFKDAGVRVHQVASPDQLETLLYQALTEQRTQDSRRQSAPPAASPVRQYPPAGKSAPPAASPGRQYPPAGQSAPAPASPAPASPVRRSPPAGQSAPPPASPGHPSPRPSPRPSQSAPPPASPAHPSPRPSPPRHPSQASPGRQSPREPPAYSAPRFAEGSTIHGIPGGDRVECSVFAPANVSPGSTFMIQAFAHISSQTREATRRAKEFDADAVRRAIKTLESSVSRGTKLSFDLSMPGLRVDDPVQSMVWSGATESVQFGVSVPRRCRPGNVVGTLTVSQDWIPIGHIKFTLTVTAGPKRQTRSTVAVGEAARRYEMAFISYASEDRTTVLERVQVLSTVGVRTFQDVLNLEPGERWERSLYRHIDESDIVLLFWSKAAKKSKWVRKEVRYALERKHGNEFAPPEIGPVLIEGPPVPRPWKELAYLHFNDPRIYLMDR